MNSASPKEILAKELAARVKNSELLGIGTGSTVDAILDQLALRIKKENLKLWALVSSFESAQRCEQIGISVLTHESSPQISWGFDGADAVDKHLRLIKGKGGALLREKILAAKCPYWVVAIEERKLVENIADCLVPVEVIPEALGSVQKLLPELGAAAFTLRSGTGKHGPTITEKGNFLLDVKFSQIDDELEGKLKLITGVIDSGIFTTQASEIVIADGSGIKSLKRKR